MNQILVQAFNGTGKDKVFAGDKKIPSPVNWDEAIVAYGTMERTLKLALESEVINVQRSLRNGSGTSAKAQLNAMIAVARERAAKGESDLLNELIARDITVA